MHRGRMHRRLDHAGRDGIHPNPLLGIFDRERARDGVEAAFGQGGQRRGKRCRRLLRDRGGDVDDMAGAGLQHAGRCPLRDVKKSREVRRGRRREVGLRIVDERLGNEDAGIVHQRVDASIALDGRADDALGSVGRGDIAVDRQHRGISRNIAGPDRAGGSDDAVADGAEALHQVSADAARRAGDDDHLRFGTRRLDHSKTPAWRSSDADVVRAPAPQRRSTLHRPYPFRPGGT